MAGVSWPIPQVRVADVSGVSSGGGGGSQRPRHPLAAMVADWDDSLTTTTTPASGASVDDGDDVVGAFDVGDGGDEEGAIGRELYDLCAGVAAAAAAAAGGANLPREGALPLLTVADAADAFLSVPWPAPRRRHSWICRYRSAVHFFVDFGRPAVFVFNGP